MTSATGNGIGQPQLAPAINSKRSKLRLIRKADAGGGPAAGKGLTGPGGDDIAAGLSLLGLAVILGIWLLVFGIMEITAAFRIRRLAHG